MEAIMEKGRAKRIMQSIRARKRRKIVKSIKKNVTVRYYAHMKHLREKYKKIKSRHHDE